MSFRGGGQSLRGPVAQRGPASRPRLCLFQTSPGNQNPPTLCGLFCLTRDTGALGSGWGLPELPVTRPRPSAELSAAAGPGWKPEGDLWDARAGGHGQASAALWWCVLELQAAVGPATNTQSLDALPRATQQATPQSRTGLASSVPPA